MTSHEQNVERLKAARSRIVLVYSTVATNDEHDNQLLNMLNSSIAAVEDAIKRIEDKNRGP